MSPRRNEDGFTLIELLVAMPLALVVAAGVMWFTIVSLHQGDLVQGRASSAIQAQTGLNQLTQDLSEAVGSNSVTLSQTSTSAKVSFAIPNPSSSDAAESVIWTCPYSATPVTSSVGWCTRQVGSASAEQEIAGVESATFAPSGCTVNPGTCTGSSATDPAYIGITLDLEVASQLEPTVTTGTVTTQPAVRGASTPIIVKSGVDLRNFS